MVGLPIIALDIEGTLFSTAVSQFPRPGLFPFLEGVRRITEHVVIYSAANPDRVRGMLELTVEEGLAPDWFATIPVYCSAGHEKDLRLINEDWRRVLLVDDIPTCPADQLVNWIPLLAFEYPYPDTDTELSTILPEIEARAAEL